VLFAHHALLRGVWKAHGGVEVSTEGDAFFIAFSSASRGRRLPYPQQYGR
jgi:class 3 adenylate cyclase